MIINDKLEYGQTFPAKGKYEDSDYNTSSISREIGKRKCSKWDEQLVYFIG